jgi:glycosyltransferase involved in cell wall biosynthesis
LVHSQNVSFWAARARLPALLTIHGIQERDARYDGGGWLRKLKVPLHGWIERRARARARNIICISPYVRALLRPRPEQRLWDIENPVPDAFFETDRSPVPGRVLYAGRVSLRKNVHRLIEGFGAAARGHPDWELRLAGDESMEPAYAQECHALVNRLGLASQVRFLGPLEPEGVRRELSGAAVLALCSLNETAPLAISEAMACGVPVLASAICGVPYLVADGRTGRLVDPNRADSIAASLRQLLTTDDLGAMGALAKQAAATRFRVASVARRTIEVYQQVLRGAE